MAWMIEIKDICILVADSAMLRVFHKNIQLSKKRKKD